MRNSRLAALAIAGLSLAACSKSRPVPGEPGTVTVPDGRNGTVTVSIEACTKCHGDPQRSLPSGDKLAPAAPPKAVSTLPADQAIGAHLKHLGAGTLSTAVICSACHQIPGKASDHAAERVIFSGVARQLLPGDTRTVSPTWTAATQTCAATYCHGNFRNGVGDRSVTWNGQNQAGCGSCHGTPPGGTHPTVAAGSCGSCHPGFAGGQPALATHVNGIVDLTGGGGCTSCHGDSTRTGNDSAGVPLAPAPPATASGRAAGAHQAHLGGTSLRARAVSCADCHGDTSGYTTAHTNGAVDLRWGSLASAGGVTPQYTSATLTCTVYCHGAAFAGGSATTKPPTWTLSGPLACNACHDTPPASHTASQTLCADCHGAGYTTSTVNKATHIDGNVDLPAMSCTSCHGVAGRPGADANGQALAPAPPVGTGGQSATTTRAVGAHQPHLQKSNLRAAAISCADCHLVPAPANLGHRNGTMNFQWSVLATNGGALSPGFNGTACSNVYCHGATLAGGTESSPIWAGSFTDTGPSSLDCTSCHGNPPPAAAGHPQNDACATCHGAGYSKTGPTTGTVAVATHIDRTLNQVGGGGCTSCHGTAGRAGGGIAGVTYDANQAAAPPADSRGAATGVLVGVHLAHVNPAAASGVYKPVLCTECHPDNAGNGGHANGAVNVTFASATGADLGGYSPTFVQGNGTSTATTCATYCHGATLTGGYAGSVTSWAWNGAAAGCGSCHAFPPATAGHVGVPASAAACAACHPSVNGDGTIAIAGGLHINGRLDGGESQGGQSCGQCHGTIFNSMNGAVARTSRHALGAVVGVNDSATDSGISWGNPLSGNAPAVRACINMCHGDHPHDLPGTSATHEYNVYVDSTASSTRGGTTRNTSTRNRTDFDGALANGGLCVSCHQNPVDAARPAVTKAGFDTSAHDYTSSTVGTVTYAWTFNLHDGGAFLRNCTKCHSGDIEGRTPSQPANNAATVGVHYSVNKSLLSGTTNPAGTAAGFVCYNCHGTGANPAAGAQGNRSGKDIQSQIVHATTAGQSGHPANSDAAHDSAAEFSAAAFGNTLGGKARHASCLDCHDPHEARPTGAGRAVGSATTGNAAGPALQGAWGAQLSSNPAFWSNTAAGNFTKKVITAGTDLEATLCFKCHSAFYGTLPNAPSSSPAFAETDQAKEFNPANVGNFATTGTTSWQAGETAGSFHPVLTSSSATLGNTGNIKAPFTRTSLMTCTDCHESDVATDPNGPHGSAARFLLKGPNTTWSNSVTNTSSGMPAGTFCINCHNQNFSGGRFTNHTNGRHNIACMNCHAAIPHGGPRPGLLVAPAGANANVGASIAGWDASAPYSNPGTGSRLYLVSYPGTNATSWAQSNCGCNGTGH